MSKWTNMKGTVKIADALKIPKKQYLESDYDTGVGANPTNSAFLHASYRSNMNNTGTVYMETKLTMYVQFFDRIDQTVS